MARAFFICPRVAHGKPIETGDIMKTAVSFTAVLRVLAQHTLGMLGLSCYLLADTFFVSNRLGADGLAALNLAIPLYSLLNGVGLMLGIGGATRYAVLQAGGAAEEADRAFTGSLMLGGGAGALFVLAGILLANDPNCDTNEPPFALGGSLCAKGVHRFLRPVFSEPRTSS